ncbi:MAG: ComF family protein [Bacteroidota bacterium]
MKALSHSFLSPLLDFIFPPLCLSCNALLPDGREKVCSTCWESIQPVTKDLHLYKETRARLLEEGAFADLVSCFVFEKGGAFQHIAHALKYQSFESVGVELGRRLGGVMKDWNTGGDVLIPIPLHKIKLRERGYNQAECIAKGISSVTGIPVATNLLRRRKHTQTQTKLSLDERRSNVAEAFEILPESVPFLGNKTCILVDDVITTGSTVNSCARMLKNAGASNVIAASAALAQRDLGV